MCGCFFCSCVLSFCTLIFCFRHSSSFLEKGTERKRKIGTLESPFRERIEKSRWPSPRTTRRTISRIKRTEMVREKSRVFLRVASWEVSPRSIARNRKCVGRGAFCRAFILWRDFGEIDALAKPKRRVSRLEWAMHVMKSVCAFLHWTLHRSMGFFQRVSYCIF